MNHAKSLFALLLTTSVIATRIAAAEPLRAGVARIDLTHPQAARDRKSTRLNSSH